jgi:hypothetical protein
MARPKTRKKPHDPAAGERLRAERERNRQETERLEAQPDVVVNKDPRTKELLSAVRLDCFILLLKDPAHMEARQAVDWLETLLRNAAGENTQDRRPDHIRGSIEGAPGQNVSDAMIAASRELQVVEANLRPWEARLLFDLLRPDAARVGRWREVVKRVTGETHSNSQGTAVRLAAQNLQWVHARMPSLMKAYWERKKAA